MPNIHWQNEMLQSFLFIKKEILQKIFTGILLIIFLSNSLLVFNDTKVVEARLLFQKPTGGVIEIFCLEPHEQYPDITTAMLQHEKVLWHCLIGGASKWKHGQILEKKINYNSKELILNASYIEKDG